MKKFHVVERVHIKSGYLRLTVDGRDICKDLTELSASLANAKEEEQKEFEISPSGYGIHWPLIDEDISIDGLLGVLHNPRENKQSA